MNTHSDRPPLLRFVCLFAALLAVALGLAAMTPEPGSSGEERVQGDPRASVNTVSADAAKQATAAHLGSTRAQP
jgi:hypothetical protein